MSEIRLPECGSFTDRLAALLDEFPDIAYDTERLSERPDLILNNILELARTGGLDSQTLSSLPSRPQTQAPLVSALARTPKSVKLHRSVILCDMCAATLVWFRLDLRLADNPTLAAADAAPYFRIFSPTAQTKKFDPRDEYIRRWVPEIDTPSYPRPIINHAQARDRALDALAAMKKL